VKGCIVDIYAAVKKKVTEDIAAASRIYIATPFVWMSADIWKSDTRGENYLGIKIYFMLNWRLQKYNISIRRYVPDSMGGDQASNVLKKYIISTLLEMGITKSMIAGSTTDCGTDIKRCMAKMMNNYHEWCGAHLASRALIAGSGTCEDKQQSKNVSFRKLNTEAKNLCGKSMKSKNGEELLNENLKAKGMKAAKVLAWQHQRCASFIRCLGRLLYLWPCLETTLRSLKTPAAFKLKNKKDELVECYSILKCVETSIKNSQKDGPSVYGYM